MCLYMADVQNMVGRVPLTPLFWLVTRLQHSLTCQQAQGFRLSVKIRMAVQTRLQRTDYEAGMSTRSTRHCGCGSLGVASSAWEA
jgi:hypothetical protein